MCLREISPGVKVDVVCRDVMFPGVKVFAGRGGMSPDDKMGEGWEWEFCGVTFIRRLSYLFDNTKNVFDSNVFILKLIFFVLLLLLLLLF